MKNNRRVVQETARMKEAFETGGLSRRDFMQGLMATGLTFTAATAVLTGSRDVLAETPSNHILEAAGVKYEAFALILYIVTAIKGRVTLDRHFIS